MLSRVVACLALCYLVLTLPAAALARPAELTAVSVGPDGLRATLDLPADAEPWAGLVALPPGQTLAPANLPDGVSLGEVAIMHGIRVAPLTVTRQPDRARVVDLNLGFTAAPDAAGERTTIAATFGRLIADEMLGGDAVRQAYDEVPGTYLMICSSAVGVLEAVEPLAQWRRQQGYDVQVVTTLVTGSTNTAIKDYIQQVYETATAPLAYVCLVGDVSGAVIVPTWYETISGYHGEGDHEYTRLDGTDVLSDAHIGRLSARSVTELEGIVAKILGYERTPDTFADPGWFSRALLVGDPSASGATTIYVNQWVKEQLQALNYTQIDTIWGGNFSSLITQKFNPGISVYAYRGYLGCSGFSTGYIDNLQNQGELPFAVMPTCASGSFGATHTYTEAMLRNPHGGAIGAVGTATTGTHTRYNNCYFHGVWEGALNEPDRHLGYAHTRGKLELYRQYQVNEPNIVAIWSTWNNLMGDPATEMRQALPLVPTAIYPEVVPAAAGTLPVQVSTAGSPLAGARVAAWRDGELQVAGWTDAAGEVQLELPAGLAPGEVRVTVTGDDLVPHQGTLQIGSSTAYCAAVGWSWSDGNDGMPDPGEAGELSVQIQNLGDDPATDVTVQLDGVDSLAEVAGGPVAVGDLAPGGTVTAASWEVTLAADLPDGLPVNLAVLAQADGESWLSRAALPIDAPAFTPLNIQWDGLPGQTSTLTVTLRNDGSTAALGAVASLGLGSSFLLPAGPVSLDLGDVPVQGTTQAAFTLGVADDAWGGLLTTCELTVTTTAGTSQRLELPLTTGVATADSPVGPGTMGYLAWDSVDPVADAPTYQWLELDPNYGGSGTDVGLSDFAYEQDDTRTVELPFTFRYRGREFDRISICSNGWIALGHTYLVHWRNWSLPAAGTPDVMLAVFWDDLEQSGTNRVYHEYRADEGVYVVQWSRMRNRYNGVQNCEVVLYDPAVHPTTTGDGLVVYQYQQVTNNDTSRGYATVGIQDGQDGLTYTYYNRYASGARTLQSGRAIAFVPTAPEVPGVLALDTEAISAILRPGETRTRMLTLANDGPASSTLWWQLAVHEPAGAPVVGGDATRERTVTLLAPNGGEVWPLGSSQQFQWDHGSDVVSVNLQIDRGAGWENLATDVAADLGAWTWLVTGPSAEGCLARVVDHADVFVSDTSDGPFSITVDYPWLALSAEEGTIPGGESVEVAVTLDATDLDPGEYLAELHLLSTGGAPVIIPVRLLVDTSTVAEDDLPTALSLAPAVPNPFNPRTAIRFDLPRRAHCRLTVHDLRGHLVRTLRDAQMAAGRHEVMFDGTDDGGRGLASGTYVYRLEVAGQTQAHQMTLLK